MKIKEVFDMQFEMPVDEKRFFIGLGNWIKETRKNLNIKQDELSTYLNVSQAVISVYENGKIRIPAYKFYKLYVLFNTQLNYIFKPKEKTDD